MKRYISLVFFFVTSFLVGQNPAFKWASSFGGSYPANITPQAVAVDKDGNVYSTGHFNELVDMDPSPASYTLRPVAVYSTCVWGCSSDVFISKLDSIGNLVWAKQLIGKSVDIAYSLALDSLANVYVTGSFKDSIDCDPGPLKYYLKTSNPSSTEVFVLKLDANGNFLWAKHFPSVSGNIVSEAFSIAVDDSGYVYTTGRLNYYVDFDPGPATYTLGTPGITAFVSKLNSSGNFVWAKSLGDGSGGTWSNVIKVDKIGGVYISGFIEGINTTGDYDPGPGVSNLTCTSWGNSFITKLNNAGNFVWAKCVSGGSIDKSYAMAVDNLGNSYLSGYFNGAPDFDPGPGVYTLSTSTNDIYILKLDSFGNFAWVKKIGGSSIDVTQGMATDNLGNVYCTGYFQSTVDFDPGPGIQNFTSLGANECFILKLDSLGSFKWLAPVTGVNEETGWAITVDKKGSVYTAGTFTGTADFDASSSNFFLTSAGTAPSTFIHKMEQPLSVNVLDIHKAEGNDIYFYPSPTSGVLNVVVYAFNETTNIEIYNSIGQLLLKEKVVSTLHQINLSSFTNGIYFVKVGTGTKKIIKEN